MRTRPYRGKHLFALIAAISLSLPASLVADERDDEDGHGRHHRRHLPAETIAARTKFLGLENVNQRTGAVRTDRVILSWIGVSSFVAAFKGHVVILDAYVGRAGGFPTAPWPGIRYVGATVEELAAVKPELILFGHAHFDHAGDLPQVVRANPDAVVAGTAEHCRDIENEVRPVSFRCISMFPQGADLGSVAELPNDVLPGVDITAVKQPHSSAPPDPVADPPFPFNTPVCKTTPGLAFSLYPVQPDDPLSWDFQTAGPPSGIIAVAWQIRVGKFALLWEDTAGYIVGDCAVRGEIGCDRVPQAFANLPAPTDVRVASIVVSGRSVFSQHTNAVREKLFIPIHHDACGYIAKKDLDEEVAKLPAEIRPTVWFLTDPGDYLRPIVFDPKARAWRDDGHLND
jgi:L-ascorbate metabolism protein UlaG (beta-lactamase superfamily)